MIVPHGAAIAINLSLVRSLSVLC